MPLRLTIENIVDAEKDLAFVDAVLHDAWIDPLYKWDDQSKRYEVDISRVGYEYGRRGRFLGLIRRWLYPGVPGLFAVAPVESLSFVGKLKDNANDWLYEIVVHKESGVLSMKRTWGEMRLTLGFGACLSWTRLGHSVTLFAAIRQTTDC